MKTNLWSSAAANGLLLSLITIIFTLFSTAFPTQNYAIIFLIWIVKLTATVGTLYFFMKGFGKPLDSYPYKTAFGYGFATSLCSNIVIACYLLLHYLIIFPDSMEKVTESMDKMMQAYPQYSENQATFDFISKNMPIISAVSSFFIYTIVGLIIAAILANFAKKAEQPFANEIE